MEQQTVTISVRAQEALQTFLQFCTDTSKGDSELGQMVTDDEYSMDMLARCIYHSVLDVQNALGNVLQVGNAVMVNAPLVMQGIIARAEHLEDPLRGQAKQLYKEGLLRFLQSQGSCAFGQALSSLREIAQKELRDAFGSTATHRREAVERTSGGDKVLPDE